MCRLLGIIVLFSFVCPVDCFGQDASNYIETVNNATLNFGINTVTEIENDQTINNAITIGLRTKQKARSVYARISSFTAPTGFSVSSPYPLQLQHASNNSSSESNLITTAITLTNTDQRLFTQSKNGNLYQFNYNLILKETNWAYPPGNYNFTILFTLSPP